MKPPMLAGFRAWRVPTFSVSPKVSGWLASWPAASRFSTRLQWLMVLAPAAWVAQMPSTWGLRLLSGWGSSLKCSIECVAR